MTTAYLPASNDIYHKHQSAFSPALGGPDDAISTWIAVKHQLELAQPTSYMDAQFHSLALDAVSLLISKKHRVVIVVGGTPGSGKSTLAGHVTQLLNEAYAEVVRDRTRSLYSLSNLSASTLSSMSSGESDLSSMLLLEEADSVAPAEDAAAHIGSGGGSTLTRHEEGEFPHVIHDDGSSDDHFSLWPAAHAPLRETAFPSPAAEREPHFASTVPMDGYHLTRKQLDNFADPAHAHARRGAHWTFDAAGVVAMAQALHDSTTCPTSRPLFFPAFNHAAKDPEPNGVVVLPSTCIVILEGIYTLLDVEPWSRIAGLADLTWSVQVPLDVSRLRLARRHLKAGIVSTLAEGYARVDSNDALNASFVIDNSIAADRIIPSIQDDTMA